MIDRELAKKLARKFAGKPGFPKSDTPEGKAGLSALFDAFQNYCVDAPHAAVVAEDLAVDTHFCPTTSEVYKVAMATRPERKLPDCPHCGGTGFITREKPRRAIPGQETPPTASYAEACSCRTAQAVVDECVSEGLGV